MAEEISSDEEEAKALVDDSSNDNDSDCVILDNDPNERLLHNHINNNNNSGDGIDDSDDLLVVSEKGQVACRDYPHSRHLCIKFPFSTTPNQNHCHQCYCYVCDSLAPCVYWGNGTAAADHCRATDKDEFWIVERKTTKNGSKIGQPVTRPTPPPVHIPTGSNIVQPVTRPTPPPVHIPTPGLIHSLHTPANLQHPRNNLLTSGNKSHPDSTSQALISTHQKFNLDSTLNKPVFKRTGAARVARTVAVARRDASKAARTVTVPQTNAARVAQTNVARVARAVAVARTDGVRDTPTANQNPIRDCFGNVNRFLDTVQPNASVNHQQPQVSNHSDFYLFSGATLYQPAPPIPSIPQPVPPQPSYHAPGKTVSDLTHNEAQGLKDGGVGQGSADNSSLAGGLSGHQYRWLFDDPPIDLGFGDCSFDSGIIETAPIFDFYNS